MSSPSTPLLEIEGLRTHFFTRAGVVKAVDDVSFTVRKGEVLGLVGGLHDPRPREKVRAQAFDFEQRRAHCCAPTLAA